MALGATAAQSLLGSTFRVTKHRSEMVDSASGALITATVHPSAILRTQGADRDREYAAFVSDLRRVAQVSLRN